MVRSLRVVHCRPPESSRLCRDRGDILETLRASTLDVGGVCNTSQASMLDRLAIAAYRGGMTVILDLNPEVEVGLVTQAQARGLSLAGYLQQVLKERNATPMLTKGATENAVRARAFRAFAKSHRPVGSLILEP